ncbi:MAG TPA: cob(I)yrinic acid a,c-diamide adenosyltransferase [Nitrospirae bacterium]|nr:cob(I)yrinic acid a,c-diamide adenosyltransferase [Nitrospirota bacterium]
MLQFLKSGARNSGEINTAKKYGIKIIKFKGQTPPLFDPGVKLSELKRSVKEAIALSIDTIKSSRYDLVIMDEFNNLFSGKYATMSDVRKIIKARPEGIELVFTGRNAPEELIRIADYVTEMRLVKHPYKKGIKARKGIEF